MFQEILFLRTTAALDVDTAVNKRDQFPLVLELYVYGNKNSWSYDYLKEWGTQIFGRTSASVSHEFVKVSLNLKEIQFHTENELLSQARSPDLLPVSATPFLELSSLSSG